MTFANPVYLWGMLGAVVPVIIHLWSKQDTRVIKVGSVQLLQGQESVKSRRIHLNEFLLLLIRCLILIIASALIATPMWCSADSRGKSNYVILISPSLAESIKEYIPREQLEHASFIGLLTEGLPTLEPEKAYEKVEVNYWQLVPEINQLKEDSVFVIANYRLQHVKGKRPVTNKHITWLEAPEVEKVRSVVKAVESGSKIKVWYINSDQSTTSVESAIYTNGLPEQLERRRGEALDSVRFKRQKQWIPIQAQAPYIVAVLSNDKFESDIFLIEKALETIDELYGRDIQIKRLSDPDANLKEFNLIIDLGENEIELTSGQVLLTFKENQFADLIYSSVQSDKYHLSERLNTENAIEKGLSAQLTRIILSDSIMTQNINKLDMRSVDSQQVKPITENNKSEKAATLQDISNYGWIILLGLLVFERGLSMVRNQ